jgi:hypothetical protein
MKKLILILILPFFLLSCTSNTYITMSNRTVDGYQIYEQTHSSFFCKTYYEDVYYSGETYNYGYAFNGCSAEMSFYIIYGGEYVYLRDALDQGIITLDSLIPVLERLDRHPEEISSEEADYYWLDFHIGRNVVYAYAGGVCDQAGSETFVIDGETYTYSASGCLKDHILYMQIDGEYQDIASLITDGTIDGTYLIPLLTKSS